MKADQPATVLHARIQQANLSWDEAARLAVDAISKHENTSVSLTGRHLARLSRQERPGHRPTPIIRRALELAFNESIDKLLLPVAESGVVHDASSSPTSRTLETLSMAADRARHFRSFEMTSQEAVDTIRDDVSALALAYPTRPLDALLPDLVQAQDAVFGLLERPQRPTQGADLYFLSGVVGGMLAKASHDQGNPTAALSQTRTAWLCAEHSGHDGLRAWIRGLQSLISYWAGQPRESVRYAESGSEYALRAGNSSLAWLPASEARAWARLGNSERAQAAIQRANAAWTEVRADELDELGGIANFTEARQVYFAAEALSWLPGEDQATAEYANQAVERYSDSTRPEWAFGDAAGSRAALAISRIEQGDEAGAAETMRGVLDLPAGQRINGIIHSVRRVHEVISRQESIGATGRDLQDEIEDYTRLSLPRLPRN
ncbi:MAG: hypothetical protein L0I76_08510 [Pseudonocardia sp.]|nr:hypothetical protein [Pseudonocardia sp.]